MKRIEQLRIFTGLFSFKSIKDQENNEYVVFANNCIDYIGQIDDKTQFEYSENHVHIIDRVKKKEFCELILLANELGRSFLQTLKFNYPNKYFYVFISITLHDSMIIRFHQKWDNELPYCDPQDFNSSKERILLFEG